jgi:hypothetical protein
MWYYVDEIKNEREIHQIINDVFLKSGRDKMDFYLLYKNNLESIH